MGKKRSSNFVMFKTTARIIAPSAIGCSNERKSIESQVVLNEQKIVIVMLAVYTCDVRYIFFTLAKKQQNTFYSTENENKKRYMCSRRAGNNCGVVEQINLKIK